MARKWNIVNDNSKSSYDVGNKIIYTTEVLKSNICNYNDAHILVRGDVTSTGDNGHEVVFKKWTSFTKCTTKFDKTTTDDVADLELFILMYNLIEYSSNYSEIIGSLWFCSKGETTNVNADIANGDNFNSFKYNTKLLEKTDVDEVNRNLRIVAIPLPLKYWSNFSRLLEMSLINWKIKLKLTLREYCVFSAAYADDTKANDNNIIFTIKDIRLYVAL